MKYLVLANALKLVKGGGELGKLEVNREGSNLVNLKNSNNRHVKKTHTIGGSGCANPRWIDTSSNIILYNLNIDTYKMYLLRLNSGRFPRSIIANIYTFKVIYLE